MNYLLTYPRSGQHWYKHMLVLAGIPHIYVSHEIEFCKEWPPAEDTRLLMIVRNYMECLPRNLYRKETEDKAPITNHMVSDMFSTIFAKPFRAQQYMENLVIFDMYPYSKSLVYYEDFMMMGKDVLRMGIQQANLMRPRVEVNIRRINWEEECAISLDNYNAPKLSGGQLICHQDLLESREFMRHTMRAMNRKIYDKYLSRYDEGLDRSQFEEEGANIPVERKIKPKVITGFKANVILRKPKII